MRLEFEKVVVVVVVDFFVGGFGEKEKARLIKNQQNMKNGYSLFFNFLRPELINTGASCIKGKQYTKYLVDA